MHIKVFQLPLLGLLSMMVLSGCGLPAHSSQHNTSGSYNLTKPPLINDKSTKQDIAAYVNYYQSNGFVITKNKQIYDLNGQVSRFDFAASKHSKSSSETASADVSAATSTISVSSGTNTNMTFGF